MNAIERIKNQLSAAPVVLYMKGTPDFPQCGFSAQTVGALRACKAQFAHVNILGSGTRSAEDLFHWPTFPQLYVNGTVDRRLGHRDRDTRAANSATLPKPAPWRPKPSA
jgi:monothiol glutaredoxin